MCRSALGHVHYLHGIGCDDLILRVVAELQPQLLVGAAETRRLASARAAPTSPSESITVSKLEKGTQALRDVTELRHIARKLGIPPERLGVLPDHSADAHRFASHVSDRSGRSGTARNAGEVASLATR